MVCGALGVLLAGSLASRAENRRLAAADGAAAEASAAAASVPIGTDVLRTDLRPNVRLGVAPAVAMKLRAGFDLALDRVERESACRALFADLGGEAREALGGTLYYGSTPAQEDGRCRYAYAVTQIGSAVTWVCQRNFVEVGLEHAARILIHEALHRAGLPERPQAPDAMSAREIDRIIHTRCGL
jgi:hypothetical protein